ncbi:putative dihydrofolate reductase [Paratrimastix pyriformis]|uniref:Dihydrofolate reductase n=1 Tax=Paratrimastix pyriformis TaxID=342808 RepID=A0ABQ8UWX6_9EUKA|nr:putative dihydrofolate reductase [Paratrimastix pyriformis]
MTQRSPTGQPAGALPWRCDGPARRRTCTKSLGLSQRPETPTRLSPALLLFPGPTRLAPYPAHALDWLLQFPTPTGEIERFLATVGAVAMGSLTYEWLLEHHVDPNTRQPLPWPYTQPVWVFTSRSLPSVPNADIRFAAGDVRPVHHQMAQAAAGKNIYLVGGGELVAQFHDHGLLDEIIVQVTPVTLGAGTPLLPRRITAPPLRLRAVRSLADTFAELHYEVPHPSPTDHTTPSSLPSAG